MQRLQLDVWWDENTLTQDPLTNVLRSLQNLILILCGCTVFWWQSFPICMLLKCQCGLLINSFLGINRQWELTTTMKMNWRCNLGLSDSVKEHMPEFQEQTNTHTHTHTHTHTQTYTPDVSTVKPYRVVSVCTLTIVFGPVREAGPPSLSAFMWKGLVCRKP